MEEILELVETIKVDYDKAQKGNKSASTRTRNGLQKLKKVAQTLKLQLLEASKVID